jgi:DNA-binding MarR family transcriptional regulator
MKRDQLEQHITVRLFQASNALQTFLDQLLKQDNVTAKQFFMMIIMGSFDYDPKLGELAERFGTSHQNVKQIVKKLEQRGYVKLYKDEDDSRITRTRFTEQAMLYWKERDEQDQQSMKRLYSDLNSNQMEQMLEGLLALLKRLENWDE